MINYWCFVFIILILIDTYSGVLADVQRGVLPLDLSPSEDAQISPRRQKLISLLTELIEKHVPLGVWTRGDDALSTSRSRDRTLWDDFKSRGEFDIKAGIKTDEAARSGIQRRISYRDRIVNDEQNVNVDVSRRRRPSTTSSNPSRSKFTEQNVQRHDSRRKVFIKTRNGERIEIGGNNNPISSFRRRRPTTSRSKQPGEECNEDSLIHDGGYTYDDQRDSFQKFEDSVKFNRNNERNNVNIKKGYDYNENDGEQTYPNEEGYNSDFEFTLEQAKSLKTHRACTITAYAANLIRAWKNEMQENQKLHLSNIGSSSDYADYDDDDTYSSTRGPEPPSWFTSMTLRGLLSAPMAGYTENYTLWYDADSGESRLEFNGGMTTMLRLRTSNGLYKLLGMQYTAQPDGSTRRVCRVAKRMALSFAEMAPTALPDMSQFTFQGFLKSSQQWVTGIKTSDKRVEIWQLVKNEKISASETACEEELTYRHEILIERRSDGAIPIRYSVEIDSSILGEVSDIYVHTYQEVELATPSSDTFFFSERAECEQYEKANVADPEQYAYFDPLREFKSITRGSLYTERILFNRYKKRFAKKYNDGVEEVLRSNILMHQNRFVNAVNRRGKSFTLEINHIGDLLKDEIKEQLFGAVPFQHGGPVAPTPPFPYKGPSLRKKAKSLPPNFDWRHRGWDTPVNDQKRCASCWAHAVVGAVEGAFFARTNQNLDLSEQSVVDCGDWTGGNKCNATWPFYGYEYARQYGLPEFEKYGPPGHGDRVGECKKDRVSPAVFISGHVNVTAGSVSALKVAIHEFGPVAVLIDSSSKYFLNIKTGILEDPVCSKMNKDAHHLVLALGWGETAEGETYFVVKNSWGAGWGENGYVNLVGKNACAILTAPSYPLFPRDAA